MAAPNPCKLQHFLHFLNRCFALMNAKNVGIYAFFKKSKVVTWTKPCKKQCFSHFRGLKLWYLRGFLPSDSARCCKLQHSVRCLRSIFEPAMFSPVFCILPQETMLQIETGRQRDLKESWMEELQRSFLRIQGLLRREVFRQRSFLHTEGFTQRSLYSKELLHINV